MYKIILCKNDFFYGILGNYWIMMMNVEKRDTNMENMSVFGVDVVDVVGDVVEDPIFHVYAVFGYRPATTDPKAVQIDFSPNYFAGFTNDLLSARELSDVDKEYYDGLEPGSYENIFKLYICKEEIIYPPMPYPMDDLYNADTYMHYDIATTQPYVGSLNAYTEDDADGDPIERLYVHPTSDRGKLLTDNYVICLGGDGGSVSTGEGSEEAIPHETVTLGDEQ